MDWLFLLFIERQRHLLAWQMRHLLELFAALGAGAHNHKRVMQMAADRRNPAFAHHAYSLKYYVE
jgi:hypothetical protein